MKKFILVLMLLFLVGCRDGGSDSSAVSFYDNGGSVEDKDVATYAIPEPATAILFGIGSAVALGLNRKRRR